MRRSNAVDHHEWFWERNYQPGRLCSVCTMRASPIKSILLGGRREISPALDKGWSRDPGLAFPVQEGTMPQQAWAAAMPFPDVFVAPGGIAPCASAVASRRRRRSARSLPAPPPPPGAKAGLELIRIERGEDPAGGVARRDLLRRLQDCPRPCLLRPPEGLDLDSGVGSTDDRAQRDGYDVQELVPRRPAHLQIVRVPKMSENAGHRRRMHQAPPASGERVRRRA
jgi:hypothetical protein